MARSAAQKRATKKMQAANRRKRAASKPSPPRRARKSNGSKMAAGLGIWPLAPAKLGRNIGWANSFSSALLGKDFSNGFSGNPSFSDTIKAATEGGNDRVDWVKRTFGTNPNGGLGYWAEGTTLGTKLSFISTAVQANVKGSFTSQNGLKRTFMPAIIGEGVYQGAKALKANQVVPPALRKYIKVY